MRVALTDHIANKSLLAGQVGTVHSWRWSKKEPRPSVVYVKFDDATWQLDGIDEPGVYPIQPKGADWHLDRNRGEGKKKLLKVTRTQLPLAPAYGMTAHSSQGKTLRAALVDLQIDRRVNQSYGAVATTRVRSREDILVLRPFPISLYQRGPQAGPGLLLKQLRGEDVNWANYRDSRRPCAACSKCRQIKRLDDFSHEQWEKARANRPATCAACIHTDGRWKRRKLENSAEKTECVNCKTKKIADAFPRAQLEQEGAADKRRCLKCLKIAVTELACCRCAEAKDVLEFDPTMLTMPLDAAACRACQADVQQKPLESKLRAGWFTCRGCAQMCPDAAGRGSDRRRWCLNCSRSDRVMGQQTCRNRNCKRKFAEEQIANEPRKRYCPDCRRR